MRKPNQYFFMENICLIELYDIGKAVCAYAIIDVEDYEKVRFRRWSMDSRGYVQSSRQGGRGLMLHKAILGLSVSSMDSDHINGDKLDNRKSKLRICTHQQNCCNSELPRDNTSGYRGVVRQGHQKWRAQIKVDGNCIYLGTFDNKKVAAYAYNEAALKHFGEFARPNILFRAERLPLRCPNVGQRS